MKIARYISIILLDLAGIVLIGGQHKLIGGLILAMGALTLWFTGRAFRRELLLVFVSIGLLGLTPISTDISYRNFLVMGVLLGLAVAIPYLVSRYMYRDQAVHFTLHHGRKWFKKEILYIFVTAVVTYFLLPFLLLNTGSYLNWTVDPGLGNIGRLFLGTNTLGIWDELFFICTTLGILRRHLPFPAANLAQAVLFTSFLYELGFRGWAPAVIFGFALLQGYIFKQTESLYYVITIHLVADFVLFLALIYTHHPTWVPIFIAH